MPTTTDAPHPPGSNGNGGPKPPPTPEQERLLKELLHNVATSRSELWKRLLDPRRDLDAECGYPDSKAAVPAATFQELYDREAIACRVVQVLPRESWQVTPEVYEAEDAEEATPFEEAWDNLGRQLRGEQSFYQDESGSPVWECLKRADELSGIGQYGVVLLGVDDGEKDLARPAKAGKGRKLLYLRVFPESLAQAVRFEDDPSSPRFGQPTEYLVTFNDPRDVTQSAALGITTATRNVHWSRVVHVADNLGSSEVFGVPRMRPVLNRLLDLRKVYGASAEMYWRGAFYGLSLETNPALGGAVKVDREGVRDMMEDYSNGLQRYLTLMGMTAKVLSPTVVDPTPQIAVHIEAICIVLGIPIRVFKGSERGELASSQDDAAWNDRLKERQRNYLTPRVVVPLVDRLISLGVLPEPKGYSVAWPDLTSQTDAEKASVAAQRTTAMGAYVGGQLDSLMAPLDYLTRELKYSEEEALAILENVTKHQEEQQQAELLASPDLGWGGEDQQGGASQLDYDPNAGGGDQGQGLTPDGRAPEDMPGDSTPSGLPVTGKSPTGNRTWEPVANAFCATGEGGGQDNSCSSREGGGAASLPVTAGPTYTTSLPPVLGRIQNHGLSSSAMGAKAKAAVVKAYVQLKDALAPAVAKLLDKVEYSGIKVTAGAKVPVDAAGIVLPGGPKGDTAWVGVSEKHLTANKGSRAYADPSPEGKVRHETGHALEHLLPYETMAQVRKSLLVDGAKWKPSLYGEENHKEKFAEFVALITKPGFKASSLPKEVRPAARILLGKRADNVADGWRPVNAD
jgi:uncharacterized protein